MVCAIASSLFLILFNGPAATRQKASPLRMNPFATAATSSTFSPNECCHPRFNPFWISSSRSIDNNAAERALRSVAVGRKNYLFLGSDAGGERAATLYSLLGTAKLNGINPEAYLRHVLSVIADHPVNRVDELLPWRVQL